jgi:hypothetical protein
MYEQIDSEGNLQRLMDEIINNRKLGDAVHHDYGRTKDGKARQTTRCWKLCIKWKDGSTSWEKLALMKEGYPIEVAEYTMTNKLMTEPAFKWWVSDVLRRRERILKDT